jgi:hypothetical protein
MVSILPAWPRLMRGQEKLLPEQQAYARQFAQERIAALFATTAIDEQAAEQHLRDAYHVAGLVPPAAIRWFDSPIAFVMAHFGGGASVWDSVGASVWASVRASVWDSVGASVWASVRASVWDSVGDSVGASVWASVRASVWDSVGDSVRAYYDENWLAFYRFFHEVFEENDLIHLALFNEMVSGYRLGHTEAWLVRKPTILARDEQGRLHSVSGKCLAYRDGWGFYAWHGVRIPERLILQPDTLTKDDWLHEENMEVRRVIQERMSDFVQVIGGRCINVGCYGELYEIDIRPDPERVARYVHVCDTSTAREYYLRVPPAIANADEAVAWTFGLEMGAYAPLQEA